jgi:hypothetical protein
MSASRLHYGFDFCQPAIPRRPEGRYVRTEATSREALLPATGTPP